MIFWTCWFLVGFLCATGMSLFWGLRVKEIPEFLCITISGFLGALALILTLFWHFAEKYLQYLIDNKEKQLISPLFEDKND